MSAEFFRFVFREVYWELFIDLIEALVVNKV